MLSAILTADNHLGAYYHRYRPDRLEARRRVLRGSFGRVVEEAMHRRVDLFLHAGDLFDRPDPRNVERSFVAAQLRRLQEAGIPVFMIAGNHDRPRSPGYDAAALPHDELAALGALQLFRQTDRLTPCELQIGGQRLCIWGVSSDFNRPEIQCPLEDLGAAHERGGDTDLVLLHYGVEGWTPGVGREPTLTLTGLARLDTDLIGVGHLHKPNNRRLCSGAVLLNPGATEHINFGEEALDCGFYLLHFVRGECHAEYLSLPTQPMQTLQIDLAIARDQSSISSRIERSSRPEGLLRVQLRGIIPSGQFHALDLPALQQFGAERNFHFQLETTRLEVATAARKESIGFGVSFDIEREIRRAAESLSEEQGSAEDAGLVKAAEARVIAAYRERQ